jgi:hypothetical protein
MAREAGFTWEPINNIIGPLKRFEQLVRADEREEGQRWFDAVTAQHKQMILAEREACAKVCDDRAFQFFSESPFFVEMHGLADAIRARGQA